MQTKNVNLNIQPRRWRPGAPLPVRQLLEPRRKEFVKPPSSSFIVGFYRPNDSWMGRSDVTYKVKGRCAPEVGGTTLHHASPRRMAVTSGGWGSAAAQNTESHQRNSLPCPTHPGPPQKNGYVVSPLAFQERIPGPPGRSAPPTPGTENKRNYASPLEPACCSTLKPALPPKPSQGPPVYREPPRPPPPSVPPPCRDPLPSAETSYSCGIAKEEDSHASASGHHLSSGGAICQENNCPPLPQSQKPDKGCHGDGEGAAAPAQVATRTHAWVQEQKSSGKLVGERLTSLQRKLRSLLTQTPQTIHKEQPAAEGGVNKLLSRSSDNKLSYGDGLDNPSLSISPDEANQRNQNSMATGLRPNTAPPSNEQRLSYISTSSVGSSSVATTVSPPGCQGRPLTAIDRHPFQPASNQQEQEDVADSVHLRDTCNKLFTREQRSSWSNYLSPRNCYSNNIKSAYDYDKLVPKEAIGKPCQEKKTPELASNPRRLYEGVTPLPSLVKPPELPKKQPPMPVAKSLSPQDTRYYYMRELRHFREEARLPDVTQKEMKMSNQDCSGPESNATPKNDSLRDGGDNSDQYKSSSESGRGTMHSGMHSSKGPVSPHSSGVSAASNLDTSLDSDHSVSGALWKQQKHRMCPSHGASMMPSSGQGGEGLSRGKQSRHSHDGHNVTSASRKQQEKDEDDALCRDDASASESLSVTPPLPPLSPPPSPPVSADNSPQVSPKAKYKLSLSTTALNSYYSNPSEHSPKTTDGSKNGPGPATAATKASQGKKNGVRRTSSITQATCRHWGGKSKSQSRSGGGTSAHRLGVVHAGGRKGHGSPPSRHHHSRIPLGFPCYPDLADPEMTSTTTGLDMESLLDDPDDFSSDMSATTSTMDPTEVSMIRKQLEGLETMYSEILRLLGVKTSPCKSSSRGGSSSDLLRHSRRRVHGSLSSLTGRSSVSRGTHSFMDKRGYSERRRSKDTRSGAASKRLQRLESHVVTLARSVAHLSSEMRTQHMLVQELENMRRDVTWVQERLRLMQLAQGSVAPGNTPGGKGQQMPLPRDWEQFRREVLELLNPNRAKKLTKFFGDEPPLIRQFLKRLGYEKYAPNFESEKIGIVELPYLTEERLQKIGLPMGPRMRILQEAHMSCQQNQYKVYIV